MSAELSSTMILGDVELILIPAGEFTMGKRDMWMREAELAALHYGHEFRPTQRELDELRQRQVLYLDAFYIGKYPITNAQYKRFVEATGQGAPRMLFDPLHQEGKEDHPVVFVSWHDTLAYCQWLSHETGQVVRLPTEAEWEKAARGTDVRPYPWGNDFDARRCNVFESYIGNTTPVGHYSPQGDSPYGVADMAGNVWERTSSLFWTIPYHPDDGREDLEKEGDRVVRGGSFCHDSSNACCDYRNRDFPVDRLAYVGFRIVVSSGSPQ